MTGVQTCALPISDYTGLVPAMKKFVRVPDRQPGWEAYVIAAVSGSGGSVVPIFGTSTLAADLKKMGIPEPVIQLVLAGLEEAYDTLNQMQ